MTRLAGGSLIGLMAALALGCPGKAPPKKAAPVSAEELAKLPPNFKLDLPTAPVTAKASAVPERHADGAFSVQGLMKRRDEQLDKEVTVTGFVVRIHLPTEKQCEAGCTPPHLYLADTPDTEDAAGQLLVADFQSEQVNGLEKGARATIVGTFTRQSASRFSRTEGLLAFKSLRGPEAK